MDIDHNHGSTVLHQDSNYSPPKSWRTWLIGRPLSTADAPNETIGKAVGLAVFASDALSSTAYATQEMMVILALAGSAAFGLSVPISLAIIALLAILTISYEQTIHAYPNGGGAYIVARDNLGEFPALVAAAALLTDYILTVAVSISSGVAQLVSAFPVLYEYRVTVAVILVFVIMVINLRGVRESGRALSLPTYFFVFIMYGMVITGFIKFFTGTLGTVIDPPELELIGSMQPITFFLILRAFSNGTSAVTGVEAISNGITAFKEPRSKNAGITLIFMSLILGSLMFGITFLAYHLHSVPSEFETIISQIARSIFSGRGLLYLAVIGATTIILVLAGNTAFAGFPRLGALVAQDGFLPRQLTYRGSRLVYSYGIVSLALIANLLVILFQASVTNLIPLYAIGVFLSFTLSQLGMAVRWHKSGKLKEGETYQERGSVLHRDSKWQLKMFFNGFGAVTTAVVMVVFAVTKFADGAWIVILLLPILISIFLVISHHYKAVAGKLTLENYGSAPVITRQRVLIPIGGVHRGTLAALRYARTISDDITAVHVSIDQEETEKIQKKWDSWGEGYRLVILESPYRLFIEPLLKYIDIVDERSQPNEVITIVVPQFVPAKAWSNVLHTRTANTLRNVLLNRPDIVITEVPYQVK